MPKSMAEEVLALSNWKTFIAIVLNRCGMAMNLRNTFIPHMTAAVNLVAKTNSTVVGCY